MTDLALSAFLSESVASGESAPALEKVVESGSLRAYLYDLVKNPSDKLDTLCAYRHPNGFTKVRVLAESGRWALRLHVWQTPQQDTDVHNHRWDFVSRILCGSLLERQYSVSEFGAGRWRLSDCWKTDEITYAYRDRGPCEVIRVAEREHRQDTTYMLRFSVLHEAYPSPSQPLITVFLQGPDRMQSTTVVSPAASVVPAELPPSRVSGADLEDVLWQVIQHLPQ